MWAAVASLSLLFACAALLGPAKSAQLSRFECEVEAVTPLAGDVLDATQLMRDVYTGKAHLNDVAAWTGASDDAIDAANEALRKCGTNFLQVPDDAPAAEPTQLM